MFRGASHSKLVLLDSSGKILARTEWTGTNYYLLGLEKAAHEIAQLVDKGRKEAGLSLDVPLAGLVNNHLSDLFDEKYHCSRVWLCPVLKTTA